MSRITLDDVFCFLKINKKNVLCQKKKFFYFSQSTISRVQLHRFYLNDTIVHEKFRSFTKTIPISICSREGGYVNGLSDKSKFLKKNFWIIFIQTKSSLKRIKNLLSQCFLYLHNFFNVFHFWIFINKFVF